MEHEVPAGRRVAQRSVSRHIAMRDRELSVSQCQPSDLASIDHNNHNDCDKTNNNDNGNDNDVRQSTTSHVQRPMAVTGKERHGGRNVILTSLSDERPSLWTDPVVHSS